MNSALGSTVGMVIQDPPVSHGCVFFSIPSKVSSAVDESDGLALSLRLQVIAAKPASIPLQERHIHTYIHVCPRRA
jgi:hypothetical protein